MEWRSIWIKVHFELGINHEHGLKQEEMALSTCVEGLGYMEWRSICVEVHFELEVNHEHGLKQKEIALSTYVEGFS